MSQKTALETQGIHNAFNPFRAHYELLFCGPLNGTTVQQHVPNVMDRRKG